MHVHMYAINVCFIDLHVLRARYWPLRTKELRWSMEVWPRSLLETGSG